MEQAKCWESILELISQLDRIQSAACIQGSHDKGFKSFRRVIPTTRENSPNLMKIHSPFRVIRFPLNDLLDSKMRDNGVIINHHETCLIWPLAISDTNFNSKFDILRGFQFDVFLMELLRHESVRLLIEHHFESLPMKAALLISLPYRNLWVENFEVWIWQNFSYFNYPYVRVLSRLRHQPISDWAVCITSKWLLS